MDMSDAERSRARSDDADAAADVALPIVCPGFVDLQVNGFAGVDFNDGRLTPDRLRSALDAMRATGVTRCLPTLITSSFERFAAAARVVARHPDPAVAGIHMEGPYLSRIDGPRGAHQLAFVRDASVDDFQRRQDAADGAIRLLTLAPEVPGALPLIEHAVASGVRVAIGHTDASPAQIRDAVSAGATLSTHLGNGCALTLPRHPNVIWEQLAADALFASLIVDGHHLPASTEAVMVRAKSPERVLLITDATAAAAAAPGRYTLGDADIERTASGRVSQPGAAHLAGSALTLDAAIGRMVRDTGLPLACVLAMAHEQPARWLGVAPAGRVHARWWPRTYTLEIENTSSD